VGVGLSGSGAKWEWGRPAVLCAHPPAPSSGTQLVAASYRRGAGPACPVPVGSRVRAAAQAMETARAQAAATLQAEMQARLPLPAGGPLRLTAAPCRVSPRLAGGSSRLPSTHMSHGRGSVGVYLGIGMTCWNAACNAVRCTPESC
jgi:hypothetical protein